MGVGTEAFDLPPSIVASAEQARLYRRMRVDDGAIAGSSPAAWKPHDYRALTAAGDAFGGRLAPDAAYAAIMQVCQDAHLYWALGAGELDAMGRVLAGCWRALGVVAGDRVIIYDYGSSPAALFASRHFQPYLRRGAADLLDCVPICNDGLPELASRAVHLASYVRPRLTFVGGHALDPLRRALEQAPEQRATCDVVVTSDEDPLGSQGLAAASSKVFGRVTELLRIDLALLLAPPCPSQPDVFHPDPEQYVLEILVADEEVTREPGRTGLLVVTNRFLVTCPVIRYVSNVRAELRAGPCVCGAEQSVRPLL